MTIGIVGSRGIIETNSNQIFINNQIQKYLDVETIHCVCTGGACGVDEMALEFARAFEIEKTIIYNPQWSLYAGKSAAFVRNKKIVKESDVTFIFWDGSSKGSLLVLNICKDLYKRFYLIKQNEGVIETNVKHEETAKKKRTLIG